jgi:hypothetical protein
VPKLPRKEVSSPNRFTSLRASGSLFVVIDEINKSGRHQKEKWKKEKTHRSPLYPALALALALAIAQALASTCQSHHAKPSTMPPIYITGLRVVVCPKYFREIKGQQKQLLIDAIWDRISAYPRGAAARGGRLGIPHSRPTQVMLLFAHD